MGVADLPKIELHCHLDGILDPSMARAIRRADPSFPIDPAEFDRAYPITDMQGFFNWWNFVEEIEGSLRHFYPILGGHIERLKAQKVLYTEIMIAAGNVPADPVQAIEQVGLLRQWVNHQENGEIQIEFLICLGRQRMQDEFEERARRAFNLHESGLIAGIALAGPEIGNPVRPFHKTFARFHEAGLKIEIHAGEWCGPESVWDALQYGYPDRIGHGVSLFRDAQLIEIFQERQIHIEMCPTSNLKTGSIARLADHPVVKAKALGLNYSINTDDPGPFECSLASEYELLAQVFGFKKSDFCQIYQNAFQARFQPDLRVRGVLEALPGTP